MHTDLPPPVPTRLLAWYDRHARSLPWRARPGKAADPYHVWLSEVMLQQTTVAAVGRYYRRFLALWPTVADLAAAPVEDVLREWAGLGYYARARNLHACAKAVAVRHGGAFPDTEAGLRALPGIGEYTAAAIAAIAFDRKATVVDGNVERVVARYFAVETPLPAAKPELRRLAGTLTPEARPGDFAQAMMDLGATICTPRKPACALCPIDEGCAARAAGTQERYPLRAAKQDRPKRSGVAYLAVRAGREVLLERRPAKGLLGGMVAFPTSAWIAGDAAAPAAPPLDAEWRTLGRRVEHVFTHFALTLVLMRADLPAGTAAPDGMRWVGIDDIGAAGLPSLFAKVAAAGLR